MTFRSDSIDMLRIDELNHLHRCRNAGQIAIRGVKREERSWLQIPNLGYEPFFDQSKLLEELDRLRLNCTLLFGVFAIGIFVTFYFAFEGYYFLAVANLIGLCACLFLLHACWKNMEKAKKQWQEFSDQLPVPLPENPVAPVEVSWWSLIRQGYHVIEPHDYFDKKIGLQGKPWRIFEHPETAEKIPITKVNTYGAVPFTREIALSFRTFLNASAYLMQSNELGDIRWGIVLDTATRMCFAIPLTAQSIAAIPIEAAKGKEWFREHPDLEFIEPPAGRCRVCPFAIPRPVRRTFIPHEPSVPEPFLFGVKDVEKQLRREGWVQNVVGTNDQTSRLPTFGEWLEKSKLQGERYRCGCGDLFRWTPVHARWIAKMERLRVSYLWWFQRNV